MNENNIPTNEAHTPDRTFTQAEVDRLIGERLSQAEKAHAEQLESARREAEELGRMTDGERLRHDREALDARTAALDARERAIARRELMSEAGAMLRKRSLPESLASVLDYADAETMTASLDALEGAFRTAVQAGVDERLRGGGMSPRSVPAPRDATDMDDATYYKSRNL